MGKECRYGVRSVDMGKECRYGVRSVYERRCMYR